MAESVYIIGAPAEGRAHNGIPGTRVVACELCQQPTLFAPSSLNRPEAAIAKFICMPCAAELDRAAGGIAEIGELTEPQLAELRKAGVL